MIKSLSKKDKERGVICSSAGNDEISYHMSGERRRVMMWIVVLLSISLYMNITYSYYHYHCHYHCHYPHQAIMLRESR